MATNKKASQIKPTVSKVSKTTNSIKGLNPNDFPIVGIGASAGGLEALEQFFHNMNPNNGMAFVVIQHLDPNHVGIMPELLQRLTPMKVYQASDRFKVKPNCVYVIPPNKSMSILNDTLFLFDPVESHGLRLPINFFFNSLALDRKEKSIGIILSGMGSDGSIGVKAIKEQSGLVLVQSPESAKFDGMPRSAIESVIADIVAPADELPEKLISFLDYVPAIKADPEIDTNTKSNLDKIIILIREQTLHDFSMYKKNTLFRRIERRKSIHQIDKISNYVRFLQENPKEVDILFKDLLIGVTNFFRDAAVWEKLKQQILPDLIKELPDNYILRAWVPACSTGEEAYTLGIIFQEAQENIKKRKNITLQIFATDIDPDAIEIARKGFYNSSIANDVKPERLSRFFTPEPDGFRVNALIRDMVVFAPQNVIKDPPFTKLDILSCRNMLIYMESELQKKLISLFNYSLNPGGILLLGSAESMGNYDEGFREIDTKLKIFERKATTQLPVLIDFPSSFSRKKTIKNEKEIETVDSESIHTLADQVMLQHFTPASVMVNDKGDIIYITGRTGKYIEPIPGKANWNIFVMAREGLRNLLPIAFRKSLQSYEPVITKNIKIGTNGGSQFIDLTVQRIESPLALRGMIMIVFNEIPAIPELDILNPKTGKRSSAKRDNDAEIDYQLQRSFEELQSTREEMQTSQEELKSTNEELQSTNEELQSTNEELTTSKEEMQSLNEELQTVNIELQSKVNDYIQANNDMKNLLNSTEIATLFLDKELNIRRFTDSMVNIFKLRSSDIGRPFTDLTTDLQYPDIEKHARQVLKTLISMETSIATTDKRWFNIRIMPYRTLDDHINGLVITFTDTTVAKTLEQEIKISNEAVNNSEIRYRRLFETAQDGMLILDAETGIIIDVNPYLTDLLGYSKEQFIKKEIWEIGLLKDLVANKNKFVELQQNEYIRYDNLPIETSDGRIINVEFVSNVYFGVKSKVIQCQIRKKKDSK